MFRTVKGEETKAGTPAIFVRLTGCNFWSGLEKDRYTKSLCPFCDTRFVELIGGLIFLCPSRSVPTAQLGTLLGTLPIGSQVGSNKPGW